MTGSTLNMHYTIADPKTFGISEYEPVLPIYHSGQPEDSKEHCSDLLHRLDRIGPDRLSPENAYTYRLSGRRAGRKLPVLLLYPTTTPAMVAGVMEGPA